MSQYIIRRVLLMIPTLLGVSLLVVAFVRLLPGDAVDILVAENVTGGGTEAFQTLVEAELRDRGIDPETATFPEFNDAETAIVARELEAQGIDPESATAAQRNEVKRVMAGEAYRDVLRARLGIDQTYFEQWWEWVSNAVRGDLGTSLTGSRPVSEDLKARLPVSFQLGLYGMLFGALVAIPVGVLSAVKQDTWLDYVGRSVSIAMLALPSFFIATLVIVLASRWFSYSFPIFYEDVWENPVANTELVAPAAIILGFALSGTLMRLTRTQMLEVLRQDYIRTARAKGLREGGVIMRHAIRNALLPVVTILGLQVPVLIGGSLVLEVIFGIPGVARHLLVSINSREFPAIIAINMVIATLIVVTNLVVDVMYAYLDPRIQLS